MYQLLARHSGKALDVNGGSAANEAKVQQWTAIDNNPNQQWVVTLQSDGAYTLTHQGTNSRLDVSYNSAEDGATVWQYAANDSPAQRWEITATDNGYYKLIHQGTNKVLRRARRQERDRQWSQSDSVRIWGQRKPAVEAGAVEHGGYPAPALSGPGQRPG